jgi:hypothetical protein
LVVSSKRHSRHGLGPFAGAAACRFEVIAFSTMGTLASDRSRT